MILSSHLSDPTLHIIPFLHTLKMFPRKKGQLMHGLWRMQPTRTKNPVEVFTFFYVVFLFNHYRPWPMSTNCQLRLILHCLFDLCHQRCSKEAPKDINTTCFRPCVVRLSCSHLTAVQIESH